MTNFVFQNNENADGFDWSTEEQGLLLGAFFYGYVITQIPGGLFAEKFGGKWVFGLGVLLPAILTLLTPIAAYHSFTMVVVVRVLEGLANGATTPALVSMMAKWFPSSERSSMAGYTMSGYCLTECFLATNNSVHFRPTSWHCSLNAPQWSSI